MQQLQYIVFRRAGLWWFTIDGDRFGPYQGRSSATDSAIGEAKHQARTGVPARVSIDEPDDGMPVVFDSEINTH